MYQKGISYLLIGFLLLACEPSKVPSHANTSIQLSSYSIVLASDESEFVKDSTEDELWDIALETDSQELWGVPAPTPIDTNIANVRLRPIDTYQQARKNTAILRAPFIENYQKDSLISEKCRWAFTNHLLKEIFPHWYGTPWDYEGHTNTPQKGMIACGYFVSTTLKHAGIPINRYKVAQAYSKKIAATLQGVPISQSYGDIGYENFIKKFKEDTPEGLYTVGLSTHVGFLWHKGDMLYFIHSDYSYNGGVKIEKAIESPALASSNCYYIGNITHSDYLLQHWLDQEKIEVQPEVL